MLMGNCQFSGLTPGKFCLPANPITDAFSVKSMAGLHDLVPASFPLPDNPISRAAGMSGCGCNCPGGLCSCSRGMGDLSTSVSNFITSVSSGGWQTYAAIGAGVVLLVMLTGSGGKQRRSELQAAKAQYLARKSQITGRYPKRYERALAKVA